MEEKRKDTGPPPLASTAGTPQKAVEAHVPEPPTLRRRGGGQKRKASAIGGNSGSASTSSKRQAREKAAAVPLGPIHNGPLTRASRQQPNQNVLSHVKSEDASVEGVMMREEVGGGEAVQLEEEPNGVKEDLEALEKKIEDDYEAIISRDSNAHVVPVHAGWFSWIKIHSLEERMLPSFFSGKLKDRTPETYKDIRDSIMKKFHENPSVQIELKDLSELSVGTMEARQEVMEFLDYWGLINYHPFPKTDSASMDVDAPADVDESARTASLVEKLFRFETEVSYVPIVPKSNVATPAVPSGLFPESTIAEELIKSEGPAVEYHCNSCSADCSRKRYHCQKQADFDLCSECFNNGKFGSDMSPSDFILMEPAEAGGASSGKWTDQETILLLEALELYKENWNEIAEHVATKTKAQCILHFIEMPIEDTFLDCDDDIDGPPKVNTNVVSTAPTETSEVKNNLETSPPTNPPKTIESKDNVDDIQPSPPSLDILNPQDVGESNVRQEVGRNFALRALKEAFEVVGSLPSPEERLSFSNASNPVMTLAAFLVRLVESNCATASVRNSLKFVSGNSSSEHLAARHCFVLEDPPDIKKNIIITQSAATEIVEQDAQEDEVENDQGKTEEKLDPESDSFGMSNDQNNEKSKQIAEEEKIGSPGGERVDISDSVKEPEKADALEPDGTAIKGPPSTAAEEETQAVCMSEPNNSDKKEQVPSTAEESGGSTSITDLPASIKESSGGATVGELPQPSDAPKDEDMKSETEKEEPDQPLMPSSTDEKEANRASGEEVRDNKSDEKDSVEDKHDLDIDKIKRVAITALSAAAVKAKLLANQEEEQIRQLASFLIEKQLHKLETKLAFFNDMDHVVMKMRDQLDRSKQRLFHERAQIIASRLGMSASSPRPMSQPFPANKAAIVFGNAAGRSHLGVANPRPPISRPMMQSIPGSNNLMPGIGIVSSMQQPNPERFSSASTK